MDFYILFIKEKKNNIFLTLSNRYGEVLYKLSSGVSLKKKDVKIKKIKNKKKKMDLVRILKFIKMIKLFCEYCNFKKLIISINNNKFSYYKLKYILKGFQFYKNNLKLLGILHREKINHNSGIRLKKLRRI